MLDFTPARPPPSRSPITAPHLLFRSDVLPNLRSLALGEYQTVTAVEVDDESEGSDDDGDDHYRELDLDTTDFPLLPQLRALSAPHLPALALTSIEVLDAFSHDIRAVTLPRSLRVLRVVALLGPVPEPELAQVLQTLLILEELHLVGYKEEDEDSKSAWVDVRRWCADKGELSSTTLTTCSSGMTLRFGASLTRCRRGSVWTCRWSGRGR